MSLIQLGRDAIPGLALKLNPVPAQALSTQMVQRKPGLALPEETMSLKLDGKFTQVPGLLEPVNLRSRKSLWLLLDAE